MRSRVQRSSFAALYGPAARIYDRFTGWLFLGEWALWQDAALEHLPPGAVVMELGSGTGAFAVRAAATRRCWCCVERSGAMVAVARARCRRAGVALVRADARALPLRDGAFEAAAATFPAAYILAGETATELARVLQPGGTLVVVLSGRLRPSGFGRRWRSALLRTFYGPTNDTDSAGNTFAVAGFSGTVHGTKTPHGEALIYVGTRYLEAPETGRLAP